MARFTLFAALLIACLCARPAVAQTSPTDLEKKTAEQIELLNDRAVRLEAIIRKLEAAVMQQEKEKTKKPEGKVELTMMTYKYASAPELAKLLRELFPAKNDSLPRIAADPVTNTILIRGESTVIGEIEAITSRLEHLAHKQHVLRLEKEGAK
jgi:hypothetical protein